MPQTGRNQNNFAFLGFALSAMNLITGLLGKAKKD
ncbi:LPXTG cell wall anchor domain-containing protein [Lactobacillus ultunensis]|nr:LPXTG cell wall anchor domain-containing protein [Lactobacillus ultunensis]